MTKFVPLIAGVTAAAALLLTGCVAGSQDGIARRDPGVTTTDAAVTTTGASGAGVTSPPASTGECDDITYSDPWIAFSPSLSDGDELEVGDQGWVSNADSADDIEIGGDVDAVKVTDQSASTMIECGEVTGSTDWVQVDAIGPGTTTLTVDGNSMTITITTG